MKIYTNNIPEKYLCSMLLYVDAGSNRDGDEKGIAHVTEHMLVAFDKQRSPDSRCRYEVSAHTSYAYMVFVVRYDKRCVGEKEVSDLLNQIASGTSIRWETLEECREDVIEEIRTRQSGQKEVLRIIGEPELLQHLPLGEPDSVSSLNEHKMKRYLEEVFFPASKLWISVIPGGRYHYDICVKKETGNFQFMDTENRKDKMLDYIYKDILYLMFEDKTFGGNSPVRLWNVMDKSYLICEKGHSEKILFEQLNSRRRFFKYLYYLRYKYIFAGNFNISNMNQILIEAAGSHTAVYQMKDLRRVLYGTGSLKLYKWYLDYIDGLHIRYI